jgi:predicted PurR-regulated permease PerM
MGTLQAFSAIHERDPAISLNRWQAIATNSNGSFKGQHPKLTLGFLAREPKMADVETRTTGDVPLVTAAPKRVTLTNGVALLLAAAGLLILWQLSSSILLVFAGVLLASFLDACARLLVPLGLSRQWRICVVVLALAGLLALTIMWSAGKLPEQARYLVSEIDTQLDVLEKYLAGFGLQIFGPDAARDLSLWLPDHRQLFGQAQRAVGTATGVLANTFAILFLGILFSFSPHVYRDSIVALVKPSYRARTRATLNEMGLVLQYWLVGQIFRIVLMAVAVWLLLYLIGVPGALLLGLQAGLSNFIPYIGPIAAGFPIALVAMPLGPSTLIVAVAAYTVVQSIEGYVIGPLILRHAVEIPPAWTLVAIVIMGSLFGVMGVALATPLAAIGRVALLRFYLEDCLGDAEGEAAIVRSS